MERRLFEECMEQILMGPSLPQPLHLLLHLTLTSTVCIFLSAAMNKCTLCVIIFPCYTDAQYNISLQSTVTDIASVVRRQNSDLSGFQNSTANAFNEIQL